MKKVCVYLLFFSLFLLMTVQSFAAEKMQIAVLDLQPKGVSNLVAGAVSNIIRSEMVRTGLYVVIERGQMDEIFREQGLQQTGCTDQACAVQLGKMLSARKILLGEVTKMGASIMITVRIVDVEKGSSDFAAKEKAENEDALDRAGENITRKLSQNIMGKTPGYSIESKTRTGYYTRSIMPGWGQLYAGHDAKGYIFMGTFIASAGYTLYSYYAFSKAEKDYNDLPRTSTAAEFDSKFNDKKKAGQMLFMAGGITAAVYLIHWVDVLFFSAPEFDGSQSINYTPYPHFTVSAGLDSFNNDRTVSLGTVWRF